MTIKYEYCITVPRTVVHDCRCWMDLVSQGHCSAFPPKNSWSNTQRDPNNSQHRSRTYCWNPEADIWVEVFRWLSPLLHEVFIHSKFLLKVMHCCQPLILTATCHWFVIDCARKRKVMLIATCSYISKIMPIIILVFVNYDHFSRKCRNYALSFYFKFDKNTSITMEKKQMAITNNYIYIYM